MQPELPTDSTPVPPVAPQETAASPTQHGLPDLDTAGVSQPSLSPARDEGGAGTPAEQLAADAAFAASLQEGERPVRREERRLSPRSPHESVSPKPSTPLRTAKNRIEEYEQAATPPPTKKREGPAFEVIKKQRDPADNRSPIAELPNEILTHALAHLAPNDLAAVASVSRRFHELVTTPHAWRSAFARLFLGSDSIDALERDADDESEAVVRSERRVFTRLTPLASWRSEYILRTRLLRSLERGKPVQAVASPHASRSGQSHTAQSAFRYGSHLTHPVNHLHATFGTGLNKRMPRFIHASDDIGTASSSDPYIGKIDAWGSGDPQMFLQFYERFPGDSQYGLGPGEIIGVPNVMDVSQPYGMIHGEGSPAGMVYYRSTEEKRGRFLPFSSSMSTPELGIPRISSTNEAMCAVWIAKSTVIPSMTDGLIGMLSGSSLGVLTSYSVGATTTGNNRDQRFGRGEMTARWVLSPGVPIIAIAVDNEYNAQRLSQNRIWAVVLNALGEVFYLTKFPIRSESDRGTRLDDEALERTAWLTGRSVYWNIAEPSRRAAKPDPYAQAGADGSYSPRTSWNGMSLSQDQIIAETREIADFATRKPKHFRKACLGWDMRRRLEIDFAGDDGHNAGENIVVVCCGMEDDHGADLRRYTRCRIEDRYTPTTPGTPTTTSADTRSVVGTSLFGGEGVTMPNGSKATGIPSPTEEVAGSLTPRPMLEEWRTSTLSFGRLKSCQVTATTIDCSLHAVQTQAEDPLLAFTGRSTASSPSYTPMSSTGPLASSTDIPGQRARLLAVGTHTGSVIMWDIRSPVSKRTDVVNSIDPVRVIYTQSPQISSLAMTSLCLIHGGSDGLVQAWDPLASKNTPVRTLNSKFASRYHRQAMQAQPLPAGVQGVNYYAAAAICLDPDPTVLRGVVSLGTVLLYWYYSSSAADQYKSSKRRLRRAERGSNTAGEKFSGATRVNLNNYIANEQLEMEREKQTRKKESDRFAGRFGTGLLDGSEEEMIAYAAMLSQESHELEQSRRASDSASATDSAPFTASESASAWSSDTATPAQSASPNTSSPKTDDEYDADVAEAIRLSLAASQNAPTFDMPFRQAKPKRGRKGSSGFDSPKTSPTMAAGGSRELEMSDLDFAIQLSLAEEQSRAETGFEAYGSPGRSSGSRKGKGRMV
jgi:hypothetical protein